MYFPSIPRGSYGLGDIFPSSAHVDLYGFAPKMSQQLLDGLYKISSWHLWFSANELYVIVFTLNHSNTSKVMWEKCQKQVKPAVDG